VAKKKVKKKTKKKIGRTPPAQRTPKKPGRRLTKIQKHVAERTLSTTDYEVQTYLPSQEDLKIAEAMLAGQVTREEIASATGLEKEAVTTALKNPTACAWISRRVHENIAHRLGMVDAAMMRRAMAGDVAAARLILDRYSQLTSKSMHLNISASTQDLERMADEDLLALVKSSKPELETVIDAQPVQEKDEDPPAPAELEDL
jgi:hypothetical protein